MRGENFIYFSVISGFFIGIIFSILKGLDVFEFLMATFLITAVFYLISLASVSFFIKFLNIKQIVYFNKYEMDEILDMQIKNLEKNENYIMENYEFIKKIEEEELEIIRKNKNA